MKKNLVIKITILIAAALLIFAVVVGVVIANNNSKLMNNELIRLTNVYAEYAAITGAKEVVELSNKDIDVRITVIALDGKVIEDSLVDRDTLDNHADRAEVQQAISGDNDKVVIRYSETANADMMYYGVRVTLTSGETVIVRSSMPSVNMDSYLITAAIIITTLTVVILALSVLIANNLAKTSLTPLKKVRESLENIKENKFVNIMPHEKYAEINGLLSNINDVADSLNQTMGRLNNEKLKLQYLTENMDQAVIATDSDNIVIMSNAKANALFGEIIGRPIDLCLCDKDLISTYHCSAVSNASSTLLTRERHYYRFSVNTTPYDEQEIHKIILITDITKLKLAELERREFFANCSHELKTPLTVIKGYSDLISNKMVKGNNIIKYSDSIAADADKLLGIIDDMLTLSRLDEKINGAPQKINFLSRVTAIANEIKDAYSPNIQLKLSGGERAEVNMNPANFDSLVKNVIENAYKYNKPEGTVDIAIRDTANNIIMSVQDSGVGIDAKELPRVTERFFRVERSRSATKGSGLGLAIVKHICELSNIKLDIASVVDSGTNVTLTFNKKNNVMLSRPPGRVETSKR